MSRVILKYTLSPVNGGQFAIPKGSRFLDLQMQGDHPVMWWSVPQNMGEPDSWPLRTFTIAPTGPPGYIDDALWYVGTFQLSGFVGHVFSWEPLDDGKK